MNVVAALMILADSEDFFNVIFGAIVILSIFISAIAQKRNQDKARQRMRGQSDTNADSEGHEEDGWQRVELPSYLRSLLETPEAQQARRQSQPPPTPAKAKARPEEFVRRKPQAPPKPKPKAHQRKAAQASDTSLTMPAKPAKPTKPARARLRLQSVEEARRAILYHEIFSPPMALRNDPPSWEQ